MAEKLKYKAVDLREWPKSKLEEHLNQLKTELQQLRVQKVAGTAVKQVRRIRWLRKGIARILTIMSEARREALRDEYRNKKWKPLDLRPKKTRAMRRRLSPTDAARMTLREQKRLQHFPPRRYALRPRDAVMQE
ncbi:hypothetical protein CDCA_CDCA11G3203 [Cyanidium caldarium]|uniref:60S ribosomal protein L35 n=1 Tax=Cyanidium caldarium TaxID=2771 RepID=A0AAV9IXZ0_CYACA|nr:hypothetical protein CDCA_CDCA11G3203 [Cyanidium caldarium]